MRQRYQCFYGSAPNVIEPLILRAALRFGAGGGTRTEFPHFSEIQYSATTQQPPEAYGPITVERPQNQGFSCWCQALGITQASHTQYSPVTQSLPVYWHFHWMRHEVARTVVCYGYVVNKPAVPSAESIGTGVTGNGRVGSCRDNVPPPSGCGIDREVSSGLPASRRSGG